MYKVFLGLGLLTASLVGAEAKPKEVKPSYDADLFKKDKKVIFVNAEFLYWTVDEGTLDYAIKMKQPAWGPTSDANGSYKLSEFGWDPGVRASIGYFNAPHYWDAYLQYTYYKATGHHEAHKPTQTNLYLNGTWPQPDPVNNTSLEHAHSDIELRYNLLEALVTRRFHPNPHFRMRLYGGLTTTWLRQNWEIEYKDLNDFKSHLHNHWKYTGAGLRTGLILDWFLGKGGSFLVAQASVACYAGGYHNVSKQKSDFSGAGYDSSLPMRNAHYSDTRLVPHFQVMAGPAWEQAFKTVRTEVFLGYELNIWANLHEVFVSDVSTAQGSKKVSINKDLIGIQGVTLRFNLDF